MTVTPQTNADFGIEPAASDEVDDATSVVQATETETENDSPDENTAEVEDEGQDTEVERLYVPVDEYGDHFVTVKVNGEDVEMPLSEALQGTMRQADYTRKTQELAAEKARLAALANLEEWLEKDPAGTLKALSAAFDVDPFDIEVAEEPNPIEARLAQLEAREQAAEALARQTAIVAEAEQALTQVNLPDPTYVSATEGQLQGTKALLQFALENQIGNLSVAARLLKLEQENKAQVALRQSKVADKRKAAVVEGGKSRAPDTTIAAVPKKMSLMESYQAAKQAHS